MSVKIFFMKKLIIFTDGGSRGNPGPSAVGVVICNEKLQPIKKYSEYLGKATNNEAEYQAALFAMEKIKALFGKKIAKNSEIEIRSDSEFLVKQLKGEYKVLEPKIQALFLKAWNLRLDFKKVKFKFIRREKNQQADEMVNQALDAQTKTQKLF